VSYSDFKKCCKKKNTKKIRQTLKAHISGTAWQIQLKFGIGGAPPRGNSHGKFCVFLFRECWATDAWKRRFLYSCKIHTCLSCTLGFLGRTTHYRVLIIYSLEFSVYKTKTLWQHGLSRDYNPCTQFVFYLSSLLFSVFKLVLQSWIFLTLVRVFFLVMWFTWSY